jgi:hypothetical protein
MVEFIIINAILLLANIGLTALNFKLYTEYFKDKSQANRK